MDEVWDVRSLTAAQMAELYQKLDVTELSFEQAMELLESVVSKLEGGSLSLVHSLTLQEFGSKLGKYCEELLQQSEARIETLKEEAVREADAEMLSEN